MGLYNVLHYDSPSGKGVVRIQFNNGEERLYDYKLGDTLIGLSDTLAARSYETAGIAESRVDQTDAWYYAIRIANGVIASIRPIPEDVYEAMVDRHNAQIGDDVDWRYYW